MITLRNHIGAVAFMISMFLLSGYAAAAEWRIVKMSGDVRIFYNNVTWVSLNRDRVLKPGDSIWTGHNGRVMLSSEDGRVLLKPRSLVKIPARKLRSNYTVLFQSMGTIEADIEKRNEQHFSIQSPYLAAVVKGTKFTIAIDEEQTRLSVSEGLVEAIDPDTGQSLSVAEGQFVTTMNGVPSGFSGNAPGASPPENSSGAAGSDSSTGDSNDRAGAFSPYSNKGKKSKKENNGKMLGHYK